MYQKPKYKLRRKKKDSTELPPIELVAVLVTTNFSSENPLSISSSSISVSSSSLSSSAKSRSRARFKILPKARFFPHLFRPFLKHFVRRKRAKDSPKRKFYKAKLSPGLLKVSCTQVQVPAPSTG